MAAIESRRIAAAAIARTKAGGTADAHRRRQATAGARCSAPKSQAIRPTADRLREALFNILQHSYGDPVDGARVLDLFAGTGALGLEAHVARRGVRAVRR